MNEEESQVNEGAIPVAIPGEGGKRVTALTIETEDGYTFRYTGRIDKREHVVKKEFVYFEKEEVIPPDSS